MNMQQLFTVKQIASMCPAVTEAQLRWWIFHADSNGFNRVLIKIGGRLYIDAEAFAMWLGQHRLKA